MKVEYILNGLDVARLKQHGTEYQAGKSHNNDHLFVLDNYFPFLFILLCSFLQMTAHPPAIICDDKKCAMSHQKYMRLQFVITINHMFLVI